MHIMVKNIQFAKLTDNTSNYWKELGVNIEFLNETLFKNLSTSFSIVIKKLKSKDVKELTPFFYTEDKEINTPEELIAITTDEDKMKTFLLLKEFTLRKKKSIEEYLEQSELDKKHNTLLARIWSVYSNTPDRLFEINSYHHWRNRSSDTVYTFSASLTIDKAIKIAKEKGFRDTIENTLYKKSGQANFYKVHSFSQLGKNQILFHLYKKINDKTVPDFETPVRNREVKSIMFLIDCKQRTLEIRDYTQSEKNGVLEYLSGDDFKLDCTEIKKEPFLEYHWNELRDSFLGNELGKQADEIDGTMQVSAITFKRSTIIKAPQIHFELDNGDVMEAVGEAHAKGIIDLRNLQDIKNLRIKLGNKSRTIRTVSLDTGDVIFTMDDGNLEVETKDQINNEFKERFKIPLDQPISNLYFDEGVETKVDYLMGLNKEGKLDEITQEKFNELIKNGLMERFFKIEFTCKECGEVYPEGTVECPECEVKLIKKTRSYTKVNESKTKKDFASKLELYRKESDVWTKSSNSTVSIENENYEFINFYNEDTDDAIRFLLTFKQLSTKVIKRIQRIATPTVIVYVAANNINIERFSEGCILTKNFGFFYMFHEEKFTNYMEEAELEFKKRAKHYTSQSAFKAYQTLKDFYQNKTDYTDKEFEDDVYAVVNDISLNNVKWGARYSGKVVPEGAFTLSFKVNSEEGKAVFTYDCKLSRRQDGYDLGIGEHRKAAQYLRIGADSDFLKNYLDGRGIDTHLIISNNVKVAKIKTMNEHLKGEKIGSSAKLLHLEALIRLYELYLEHFKDLQLKPNYFKKAMIELLADSEKIEITIKDVERKFTRLLKPGLIEQATLDMKELSDDFVKS
jgi:uncharacterized Zn finger protein (UPF0148 family)